MNLLDKIKNDEILNYIRCNFDNPLYLVGGAVRDFLLQNPVYDRDLIVCDTDVKNFSKLLALKLDATFVSLDEENNIYRLVLKDKINFLDITEPIQNSLEKDLMRRDFTINALAVDLHTGEIIDLSNGIVDFNNKQINPISEQNFYDDPLRMLRAYRFQANLGFVISDKILKFSDKNSKLIHNCAKERINYEMMKLFKGEFAHEALLNMGKLLEEILPVTIKLKQVPPNSHHHLDLFHHSVETVRQINNLYVDASKEVQNHLDTVDFGGFSRLTHLKLAAFLHDIGKFSTWKIIDGRHRFIKHDDVGAKMSVEILKKLCFSNKQIEYISAMIKNHIYPSSVISSPVVNEKIMMRFIRKMELNSIDVIFLAMADRLSARGPEISDDIVNKNIEGLSSLLNFYLEKSKTLEPLPVLLNGNDIMKIFNIKPSPQLGKILNELHEAQICGEVITKNDAINFVKTLL